MPRPASFPYPAMRIVTPTRRGRLPPRRHAPQCAMTLGVLRCFSGQETRYLSKTGSRNLRTPASAIKKTHAIFQDAGCPDRRPYPYPALRIVTPTRRGRLPPRRHAPQCAMTPGVLRCFSGQETRYLSKTGSRNLRTPASAIKKDARNFPGRRLPRPASLSLSGIAHRDSYATRPPTASPARTSVRDDPRESFDASPDRKLDISQKLVHEICVRLLVQSKKTHAIFQDAGCPDRRPYPYPALRIVTPTRRGRLPPRRHAPQCAMTPGVLRCFSGQETRYLSKTGSRNLRTPASAIKKDARNFPGRRLPRPASLSLSGIAHRDSYATRPPTASPARTSVRDDPGSPSMLHRTGNSKPIYGRSDVTDARLSVGSTVCKPPSHLSNVPHRIFRRDLRFLRALDPNQKYRAPIQGWPLPNRVSA